MSESEINKIVKDAVKTQPENKYSENKEKVIGHRIYLPTGTSEVDFYVRKI